MMIEHENALDLFQRVHIKDEERYPSLIDRLNRSYQLFFPNASNHRHGQLIEFFDQHRIRTKHFLHAFISDYLQFIRYREDLLRHPFQSRETLVHSSPRANKDSVESDVPVLQTRFQSDRSITFLYIDTEFQECPFDHPRVHW